ncbi:MAG: FUSC family protein [Bacillota bacterium]
MVTIGTRVIKTGIAVTITMFFCNFFKLEPAVFGVVSAVVNIQPSVYLTFKTAWEQLAVHILGVCIGLAFGYLWGGNPLTVGVATVLIILIYTRLKLKSGILMGIVAAIFILTSSSDQFLDHAFSRSLVIFTGLLVAMAVNVLLWPPRYGGLFYEKLKDCNQRSVEYFCKAVNDFISLVDKECLVPGAIRENAVSLARESRDIAIHYRNERKSYGENYDFVDPNDWFTVAEKFMNYNESMIDKADQIYDFLSARYERRISSEAGPISPEFQAILDMLGSGCTTVGRVNEKLRRIICEKVPVRSEEISETYWEELTEAIEKWQPRLIGSYYLHALIEVAVVAGELRWVAREGKKLLMLAVEKERGVLSVKQAG